MVCRLALMLTMILLVLAEKCQAIDPYAGNDPYWILLHEPAVVEELNLSQKQRQQYQRLLDDLDVRFFPLRNQSREQAIAGLTRITDEARQQLAEILDASQMKRLVEITYQKIGTPMLLRDKVAAEMQYTDAQREQIRELIDSTQKAVDELTGEVNQGKPREPLEKQYIELKTSEQKKILELLTPEQKSRWKKLLGPAFTLSKLGQPAMKAPELVDTGEWINSSPLRLADLKGKVVVVHFYACGCGNCINNYPWYREWHTRFKDQPVVLIGIHTPETSAERDAAHVRQKAADEKLAFPILIDGKQENWNAWGNSMWPSVYVLDKRGYLRSFWPGELKWQGNDGEKYMRERIEALISEPENSAGQQAARR